MHRITTITVATPNFEEGEQQVTIEASLALNVKQN
jgi:hypothetical protein